MNYIKVPYFSICRLSVSYSESCRLKKLPKELFSEDTFKPNLVPPYVKNISVVYDSENMKKYFTYVDDYGRGENNA